MRIGILRLMNRKRNDKFGSFSDGTFDSDASVMPFDDLLTNGQPHTGTFILITPVQSLEYAENALMVLGIDSDAVVFKG